MGDQKEPVARRLVESWRGMGGLDGRQDRPWATKIGRHQRQTSTPSRIGQPAALLRATTTTTKKEGKAFRATGGDDPKRSASIGPWRGKRLWNSLDLFSFSDDGSVYFGQMRRIVRRRLFFKCSLLPRAPAVRLTSLTRIFSHPLPK
eukprot:Pompholyxophrys_punicea_v1_NODE_13_length_6352_cov_32.548833.p4 type:complete len:147 gc:universal NODE_13_length_6352_cov_32.548833:959-519(-)